MFLHYFLKDMLMYLNIASPVKIEKKPISNFKENKFTPDNSDCNIK